MEIIALCAIRAHQRLLMIGPVLLGTAFKFRAVSIEKLNGSQGAGWAFEKLASSCERIMSSQNMARTFNVCPVRQKIWLSDTVLSQFRAARSDLIESAKCGLVAASGREINFMNAEGMSLGEFVRLNEDEDKRKRLQPADQCAPE
jgi:hypothetical protein